MIALLLTQAALAQPPRGAVNLGFSGNLEQGYSFLSFTPALARSEDASLTLNATVSDIYYAYTDTISDFEVNSPGVSVGPGFVYAPGDVSIGFNAGFELRRPMVSMDGADAVTTTTYGATLSSNLYWYPRHKTILYGILSFNTADEYLWTRAGVLKPLIPMFQRDAPVALWVGLEGTSAGNALSRTLEAGGVAQVPISKIRTTFSARGGVSFLDAGEEVAIQPTIGVGAYWWF